MTSKIAICAALAVIGATVAVAPANAAPGSSSAGLSAPKDHAASATDLSARRRGHRHVRHSHELKWPPAYYARPYHYQSAGMAPFFPFHYGYGLEPSW